MWEGPDIMKHASSCLRDDLAWGCTLILVVADCSAILGEDVLSNGTTSLSEMGLADPLTQASNLLMRLLGHPAAMGAAARQLSVPKRSRSPCQLKDSAAAATSNLTKAGKVQAPSTPVLVDPLFPVECWCAHWCRGRR